MSLLPINQENDDNQADSFLDEKDQTNTSIILKIEADDIWNNNKQNQ